MKQKDSLKMGLTFSFYAAINMARMSFWLLVALVMMWVSSHPSHAQDCLDPEAYAGDFTYNFTFDALQYCNGTEWVALDSGISECQPENSLYSQEQINQYGGLYHNGSVLFAATQAYSWRRAQGTDGLAAYVFDGTTLTEIAQEESRRPPVEIWADGNRVYLPMGGPGMDVYDFTGSGFNLVGSIDPPGSAVDVWAEGNLVILANGNAGFHVYDFDGSSFTEIDGADPGEYTESVTYDGTHIHVAHGREGLRAYSYDGTSATLIDTFNVHPTSGRIYEVWYDSGYIYVSFYDWSIDPRERGIIALTFNGTNYTEIARYNTGGTTIRDFSVQGDRIFPEGGRGAMPLLRFDGAAFSEEGFYTASQNSFIRGTYIYTVQPGADTQNRDPDRISIFSWTGNTNDAFIRWTDDSSASFYTDEGQRIFTAAGTQIDVLDFDGTDFTNLAGGGHGHVSQSVTRQGDYVFLDERAYGLRAYHWDESTDTLTYLTSLQDYYGHDVKRVWANEDYIYFDGGNGITVLNFDGSSFDLVAEPGYSIDVNDIYAFGDYIYGVYGTSGIVAHQLFLDGDPVPVNFRQSSDNFGPHNQGTTNGHDVTDVWSDGVFVYAAEGGEYGNLYSYLFNGSEFIVAAKSNSRYYNAESGRYGSGAVRALWGDGDYIYAAIDPSAGHEDDWISAFRHTGSGFEFLNSVEVNDVPWDVIGDGTYIYAAVDDVDGVRAFTFDGVAFTSAGDYNTPGNARGLWHDGSHLFVADGGSGVHALTFDGTSFTLAGTFNTPGYANAVWGDGTYVYVADGASGVRAYDYNGVSFTELGAFDTPGNALDVGGTGTGEIYVADDSGGLRTYTFNGTTFTETETYDLAGPQAVYVSDSNVFIGRGEWGISQINVADNGCSGIGATKCEKLIDMAVHSTGHNWQRITGDGQYLYTMADDRLSVWDFDGTTFTEVAFTTNVSSARYIYVHKDIIFTAQGGEGVVVYQFDGSAITTLASYDMTGDVVEVWGDDTGIIVGHSGGLSYIPRTLDSCDTILSPCVDPAASWGSIAYNSDHHVLQFCGKTGWRALGRVGNGDAGGGCTGPLGSEGDLIYNDSDNILQYCEGDEWVRVGL